MIGGEKKNTREKRERGREGGRKKWSEGMCSNTHLLF
jgi:hypothetical protein